MPDSAATATPVKPIFEIVTTTAGATSIRNNVVNEIMHNPVGPWAEANALYVEASDLRARLEAAAATDTELVIFDVGLGAAANALAALHCARQVPGARLRIVSFERDLDLLRFALDHADQFAHFSGFEQAMEELLARDAWAEGGLAWELRRGNFLERVVEETQRPHLIFFDPYSPKLNREMWTTACFRLMRQVSRDDAGGTLLCTYSQATPIRAALLAAGFYVGYGAGTGLKEETTQAATDRRALARPLGAPWLGRWSRSQTPFPWDCAEAEQSAFREMMATHPQFANG